VSRVAEVLGMDPFELRLKNANRIADTSPNGIAYTDPSTVQTILAISDAIGHELPADFRTMTRDARAGELLPEHLAAQVGKVDH
jgi:CO/xanthine dehydrogenase Mo-binding subunit